MGFSGSHEQSPRLMDSFHYESTDSDVVIGPDSQLREDLADAMKDCATVPISRDSGEHQQQVSLISFFAVRFFFHLLFQLMHKMRANHLYININMSSPASLTYILYG